LLAGCGHGDSSTPASGQSSFLTPSHRRWPQPLPLAEFRGRSERT